MKVRKHGWPGKEARQAVHRGGGFTLAELLIVVAIIAILIAIAIPVFTKQLEKSRDAATAANLRSAYAEATTAYVDGESTSRAELHTDGTVTVKNVVIKSSDNTIGDLADSLPFLLSDGVVSPGLREVTFYFPTDGSQSYATGNGSSGGDTPGGETPDTPPDTPPETPPGGNEPTPSVSPNTLTLTAGGAGSTLTASDFPEGAEITWTSSDPSIATVSSTGEVTPVAAGTVTITAAAGGKTASCEVTVTVEEPVSERITISNDFYDDCWTGTFYSVQNGTRDEDDLAHIADFVTLTDPADDLSNFTVTITGEIRDSAPVTGGSLYVKDGCVAIEGYNGQTTADIYEFTIRIDTPEGVTVFNQNYGNVYLWNTLFP